MVSANVEWRRKNIWVKYRDHDFFRGEDDFWVYFENLYHIYHRQALDVSIFTIWVLWVSLTSTLILFVNKNIIIYVHYKISIVSFRQETKSRKHGWHHQIGFMSPLLVNQKMLNENYKETCQNMYDSLTRQNYKSYIMIPYNYG